MQAGAEEHLRAFADGFAEAEDDGAFLEADTFELVVQVNGKVRDRVEAPTGASKDELLGLARALPNVVAHVDALVASLENLRIHGESFDLTLKARDG